MKKLKNKNKIDKGDIKFFAFLLMFSIWVIDFITTIIALKVVNDGSLFEGNKIAAWWQGFGVIGWIGGFISTAIFIYLICCLLSIVIKKKTYMWIIAIFTFYIAELIVIINNVFRIFRI